ncbi:LOW QUALITY PROTEIN: hypothetical protein RJ641_017411 [Dillenia turbinata]|uniref:Uncharacterized protein n=1 Tax=Dillenia turbinata TaxID=194707 RepID=A0AAN8YXN8_9MAGN
MLKEASKKMRNSSLNCSKELLLKSVQDHFISLQQLPITSQTLKSKKFSLVMVVSQQGSHLADCLSRVDRVKRPEDTHRIRGSGRHRFHLSGLFIKNSKQQLNCRVIGFRLTMAHNGSGTLSTPASRLAGAPEYVSYPTGEGNSSSGGTQATTNSISHRMETIF